MSCPNGGNGCGYVRWIKEPLDDPAKIVIEHVQKQLTTKFIEHESEISQSEDEVKNEDDNEDEDKDEDE